MLKLSDYQLEKLSDLFLDLAKGLFLASLAIPALTGASVLVLLRGFIGGIVFAYFSLKLIGLKETQ